MKILIADDDRVHVRLVSNYLKQRGLEPTPVYDGMQTMMFARRTNPALILLDISMPAGNGFEVLKKLKASTVAGLIPVIVVSGSIDAEAERKVIEGGADAFVRKPPDLGKLYAIICQILGLPGEPQPEPSLAKREAF